MAAGAGGCGYTIAEVIRTVTEICSTELEQDVPTASDRGLSGWQMMLEAAELRRRRLRVNIRVWQEAQRVLEPATILALLIADRNRHHPNALYAVRNPGGYLKAIVEWAKAGQLDLAASIEGIRVRAERGLQPRGPETAQ